MAAGIQRAFDAFSPEEKRQVFDSAKQGALFGATIGAVAGIGTGITCFTTDLFFQNDGSGICGSSFVERTVDFIIIDTLAATALKGTMKALEILAKKPHGVMELCRRPRRD